MTEFYVEVTLETFDLENNFRQVWKTEVCSFIAK